MSLILFVLLSNFENVIVKVRQNSLRKSYCISKNETSLKCKINNYCRAQGKKHCFHRYLRAITLETNFFNVCNKMLSIYHEDSCFKQQQEKCAFFSMLLKTSALIKNDIFIFKKSFIKLLCRLKFFEWKKIYCIFKNTLYYFDLNLFKKIARHDIVEFEYKFK